jgi:hypothetical protein
MRVFCMWRRGSLSSAYSPPSALIHSSIYKALCSDDVQFVPIVLAALCADQIADFCEQHPGIHIDMNSTAAGQNLGIDTRFDLIVYIGQPPDSSFIARPLVYISSSSYFLFPNNVNTFLPISVLS